MPEWWFAGELGDTELASVELLSYDMELDIESVSFVKIVERLLLYLLIKDECIRLTLLVVDPLVAVVAAVAAVLVSELFDINELVEETVELFLSKTLFLLEPNGWWKSEATEYLNVVLILGSSSRREDINLRWRVGRRVTTEQLIKEVKTKKKVKSKQKKGKQESWLDLYSFWFFLKKWRQKTRQGKEDNNGKNDLCKLLNE